MKAIRNFWKKAFDRMIEAREQRAAEELAQYLVNTNDDFRGCSTIDLAKAIKSKKTVFINEISL